MTHTITVEVSMWRARMWLTFCRIALPVASLLIGRERASEWAAQGAMRRARWRIKGGRRWQRVEP